MASSYQDEFYQPLRTIGTLVLATFVANMLLVLSRSFNISSSITNPLQRLMESMKKAWAAIAELRPDLVIIDISLKDGNGLDLVQEIKKEYEGLPTAGAVDV